MASCLRLFFVISLVMAVSSAAFGHPGKTDYQDGHKCLRNCEDRALNYDEYHLHDKDRNAIRNEGRKKSLKEPAPEKKSVQKSLLPEAVAVPVPASPETQNIEVQGYSMPVEEGFVLTFYDMLLLGIAGLLLLSMLVLRRKREKK